MAKNLYRVNVVLYVMAENADDARMVATNVHFDFFECEAEKARTIDPGWEDAVPYNSDNDCTCSQILGHTKQAFLPAFQPVTRLWN